MAVGKGSIASAAVAYAKPRVGGFIHAYRADRVDDTMRESPVAVPDAREFNPSVEPGALASAYARVIHGFKRDCASLMGERMLTILELQTQTGRFGYQLVRELMVRFRDTGRDPSGEFRYIMTSSSAAHIDRLQAHPWLASLRASALLDLGVIDGGDASTETILRRSRAKLTPDSVPGPLVVIANHLAGSGHRDQFLVMDDELHRLVSGFGAQAGIPIAEMGTTADATRSIPRWSGNPEFARELWRWVAFGDRRGSDGAVLSLPVVALDWLECARGLAENCLFLMPECAHDAPVGRRSGFCDRHAFIAYARAFAGVALHMAQPGQRSSAAGFLFGSVAGRHEQTAVAFAEAISNLDPEPVREPYEPASVAAISPAPSPDESPLNRRRLARARGYYLRNAHRYPPELVVEIQAKVGVAGTGVVDASTIQAIARYQRAKDLKERDGTAVATTLQAMFGADVRMRADARPGPVVSHEGTGGIVHPRVKLTALIKRAWQLLRPHVPEGTVLVAGLHSWGDTARMLEGCFADKAAELVAKGMLTRAHVDHILTGKNYGAMYGWVWSTRDGVTQYRLALPGTSRHSCGTEFDISGARTRSMMAAVANARLADPQFNALFAGYRCDDSRQSVHIKVHSPAEHEHSRNRR